MRIVFDISDRLEALIDLLCGQGVLVRIDQLEEKVMTAIDNLKTAVDNDQAATTTGIQTVADALTELASDVQALNDKIASGVNPEQVQAEADRIAGNTKTISDAFNSVAQQVKDAIPTAAPTPTPTPTPEGQKRHK